VAAQFAPQQDAVAFVAFENGAGGANLCAGPAGKAGARIDDGLFSSLVQADGVVPARGNTGPAQGAARVGDFGQAGADDTDVLDLGLGTGIGALGQGGTKLVVELDVFAHGAAKKTGQVRLL